MTKPQLKSILCCIAKDEDYYINEWIEYHLRIGFDRIIIYQNNWRANINPKFAKYVILIPFDTEYKFAQTIAYNDCIKKCRGITEWIAFFDVDEFLVIKNADTVNNWLDQYSQFDAVAVNWRYFGDSGHKLMTNDKSVINRFTMADRHPDEHIKTIVNIYRQPDNYIYICCHCTEKSLSCYSTISVDGVTWCVGPKLKQTDNILNIAYLAHFRCKTIQEYLIKSKRNNSSIFKDACIKDDMFSQFNKNDVEDLSLHDIMHRELSL